MDTIAQKSKILVAWDMDGTLVDSEKLAMRVAVDRIYDYFAGLGATYTEQEKEDFLVASFGKTARHMCEDLHQIYKLAAPNDAFFSQLNSDTIAVLEKSCEAIYGVADLLAELRSAGVEMCLVSSSSKARIDACLKATGLEEFFPEGRRFSAEESPTGITKPAPDVYNWAIKTLGYTPDQVVCVEDSPSGVGAGKAAGIKVIGFVGGGHITPAVKAQVTDKLINTGAHIVVPTMVGVGEKIREFQQYTLAA